MLHLKETAVPLHRSSLSALLGGAFRRKSHLLRLLPSLSRHPQSGWIAGRTNRPADGSSTTAPAAQAGHKHCDPCGCHVHSMIGLRPTGAMARSSVSRASFDLGCAVTCKEKLCAGQQWRALACTRLLRQDAFASWGGQKYLPLGGVRPWN